MAKITYLLLLLSMATSSCQEKIMDKKFDWSGTLSAPEEYPIEVYKGWISSEDYKQSFAGFGIVNAGWGNEAGTFVAGPDKKKVPDQLTLAWMSFEEDAFFEGSFDLPKDKISALFETGFTDADSGQKMTYSRIMVGLAPKGLVVVWLLGAGHQVEVAKFEAVKITVNKNDIPQDMKYRFEKKYRDFVLNDPMLFTPEIKAKINENGKHPAEAYENYRVKKTWFPVASQGEKALETIFGVSFYNGEMEKIAVSEVKQHLAERALPKTANFYWKNKDGAEFGAKIEFNESEIFKAFSNLDKSKIELSFQINANNEELKIALRGSEEIMLERAKIKVFPVKK